MTFRDPNVKPEDAQKAELVMTLRSTNLMNLSLGQLRQMVAISRNEVLATMNSEWKPTWTEEERATIAKELSKPAMIVAAPAEVVEETGVELDQVVIMTGRQTGKTARAKQAIAEAEAKGEKVAVLKPGKKKPMAKGRTKAAK